MAAATDSTTAPARRLLLLAPFAFRAPAPTRAARSADELLADVDRIIDGQERPAGLSGVTEEGAGAAPSLPAPAPLPSLTSALSRRAALFGAVTLAAAPAMGDPISAEAGIPAAEKAAIGMAMAAESPRGPLTLAQAEGLDFGALWSSLPASAQARIGTLALRNEMFLQLQEDGGFHTTADDRERADRLADQALDRLRPAIWDAFPTVMPTVHDEPYPLWQALDGEPPATVDVRGLGERRLVKDGWQWFVPEGSCLVELGGAVDLDSAQPGAPRRWQFWTVADIAAERVRRHPEMAEAT